jgi:DNA-binding HxlR family transcriptional regulator
VSHQPVARGLRRSTALSHSAEGIAGGDRLYNILANRLKRLVEPDKLTKRDDLTHKQKAIYSLTEMSISLVPIMAHLGAWGSRWLPVSEELSIRAKLMEEGGPAMWEQFMSELREEHLGQPPAPEYAGATPVRAKLQAAYEEVVRRKADGSQPKSEHIQ